MYFNTFPVPCVRKLKMNFGVEVGVSSPFTFNKYVFPNNVLKITIGSDQPKMAVVTKQL